MFDFKIRTEVCIIIFCSIPTPTTFSYTQYSPFDSSGLFVPISSRLSSSSLSSSSLGVNTDATAAGLVFFLRPGARLALAESRRRLARDTEMGRSSSEMGERALESRTVAASESMTAESLASPEKGMSSLR